MSVKRVLHFGMQGGIGGVETFIMEVYRHIDREKLQFDFLTNIGGEIAFSDEIHAGGGKIYPLICPKSRSISGHAKSYNEFFSALNLADYVAVHQHSNFPRYIAPLKYAKKYGISKRIFHSHNAKDMYPSNSVITNVQKRITEELTIQSMGKWATHLWACSEQAGKYMFREKYKYEVIPDAIDTKKFQFNESVRKEKRLELNLKDDFVIGFVGRLQYQKNPEYLIEIFNAICEKKPKSKLVIVGKGNLETDIRALCNKRKLMDHVLFLGARNDVASLMQAFDCFVMPSRFEGLGITYIEAQAAGLPCFASTEVPKQAKITNLMHYISLTDNPNLWADKILTGSKIQRTNRYLEIKLAGYDICDLAERLQKFYLGI